MVLDCSVGERLFLLRKSLNLTQAQLGEQLGISQKHISQIEKGNRVPSEQLIKHVALRYNTSESWIKTGAGEIFLTPQEVLTNNIAQFGEQAILKAINYVMREQGLAIVAGRPGNRSDTGDPDFDRLVNILYDLWSTGDDKFKGWIEIQFNRAFPADVIEESQKKQKETLGQVL